MKAKTLKETIDEIAEGIRRGCSLLDSGEQIAGLMEISGLSKKDVATLVGRSSTWISAVVKMATEPKVPHCLRAAIRDNIITFWQAYDAYKKMPIPQIIALVNDLRHQPKRAAKSLEGIKEKRRPLTRKRLNGHVKTKIDTVLFPLYGRTDITQHQANVANAKLQMLYWFMDLLQQ